MNDLLDDPLTAIIMAVDGVSRDALSELLCRMAERRAALLLQQAGAPAEVAT